MKNEIKIVLAIIGISFILFFLDIRICPFYNIFHIPCPGCGITRATILLLQGKVMESFSYSILPIPLFISFIIYLILYFTKKLNSVSIYLTKHKTLFITLAVITTIIVWIININNSNLY